MELKQDMDKIYVGVGVSAAEGWQEVVTKCSEAGASLFSLDTSDADGDFAGNLIKEYKQLMNSLNLNISFCAGNIVTYEAAKYLMESGADIIKVGMSSGSICTTKREKATGRAPLTALIEADRARKDYFKETGKYVPIIIDGGVANSADMVIALTIADAIMCGGYFNGFYEAAGAKLDAAFIPTTDESKMKWVETWGEGSDKARNLDRYGHGTRKSFFAEGEEGLVPYKGRLKPGFEKDLRKIKAALYNAASCSLPEYRKKAVIELESPHASQIVGSTHHMLKKGDI